MNSRFSEHATECSRTGRFGPVGLGSTRDELRYHFGEPDHVGGASRKQRVPSIWKYDEFEFHFDDEGRVWLIYTEGQDGQPRVLAGPTRG